jgi:hypothetical protein
MSAAGWSIFKTRRRHRPHKAAFDPGWGHYEVFGIARFFNDNTFGCFVSPVTTPAGPGGSPPPGKRTAAMPIGP